MLNPVDDVIHRASVIAKPFEGLHKVRGDLVYPYHDPVGFPTIGFGHLLSRKRWQRLDRWQAITINGAHSLLEKDMRRFVEGVARISPILKEPGNRDRWAAIADFAFNLGLGAYQGSTLRRKVDAGDWVEAEYQINRWTRAGGWVLPGLVARRRAEADFLLG